MPAKNNSPSSVVLAKPAKLTELGFTLVKEHARSGYEMLKNVGSPWPLAQIIHQHHERMFRKTNHQNILFAIFTTAVLPVMD